MSKAEHGGPTWKHTKTKLLKNFQKKKANKQTNKTLTYIMIKLKMYMIQMTQTLIGLVKLRRISNSKA